MGWQFSPSMYAWRYDGLGPLGVQRICRLPKTKTQLRICLLYLVLTFCSQILGDIHDCKRYLGKHTPVLMKAFIPLLIFTFIIGCLILPILLKKLRGHLSAYFFLQQLFAILYLTLILFSFIFEHKIATKILNIKFFMAFDSYVSNIKILIALLDFLKYIFHYQYYAFSLLLSLYLGLRNFL